MNVVVHYLFYSYNSLTYNNSIQIDKDILHNTYFCDCFLQSEYGAGGRYFIR
jgi:hypothetical protein